MKTLLTTTALVLTVVGISFANSSTIDGSLNTNNNNGAVTTENSHNDSSNTQVFGDTYSGTTVQNSGQANGYISNPGLTTSGADTCFGSSSGGISAAGFGISGGSTVVDENCVMLKRVKLLNSLGLKDAAIAYMVESDPAMARAMATAYPDLVTKLMGMDAVLDALVTESK